jgi:hypothetical protein
MALKVYDVRVPTGIKRLITCGFNKSWELPEELLIKLFHGVS